MDQRAREAAARAELTRGLGARERELERRRPQPPIDDLERGVELVDVDLDERTRRSG